MAIHSRSTSGRRISRSLLVGAGLLLLPAASAWAQAAPPAPSAAPAPTPAPPPPAITLPPLPQITPPPLPAGAVTPVPTTGPISVQEAATIALANQPQVGIATASVAAAAGRTRQAQSANAPSININAARTHAGTSGGGRPAVSSGSYSTSVSASQLIYDFGRTPAQIAQARQLQQAARQGFAQTQQDVVNQVKQDYYTLLQNQQLVAVQRANVADQQAHLDLTRARLSVGVAPASDVVRAETAVASAIFDLANAENAAAVARVNLNNSMGVDARTPTIVQESAEPMPPGSDAADMVAFALAHRPEIAQLRADVNASQEAVKVAETTNRPDVFFDASYGLQGSDLPPEGRNWTYGASISWPIFSGGLTRGRVEEARANLQASTETLRQGEQAVGAEVVQDYLSVQTAEQNVIAAAAEVTNAQETVRAATGRYEAGVTTFIEVTDAQAALLTAETNQVNAQYGLSLARAALARALGTEGP